MNIVDIFRRYRIPESSYRGIRLKGESVNEWNWILWELLENGLNNEDFLYVIEYFNNFDAVGYKIISKLTEFGPMYVDEYGECRVYLNDMIKDPIWSQPKPAIPFTYRQQEDSVIKWAKDGEWYNADLISVSIINYIQKLKRRDPDWFCEIPENINESNLKNLIELSGVHAWESSGNKIIGLAFNSREVDNEHGIGIKICEKRVIDVSGADFSWDDF